MPDHVRIVEVGPRDGLQNESRVLSITERLGLIDRLTDSGIRDIEVGSFVSPKWVPQMAHSAELIKHLNTRDQCTYWALTPNEKGYQDARNAGVKAVAVFTGASETFCQKNINCSIEESLNRFGEIITQAKRDGLKVRGYVSCIMGCPYEGSIDLKSVIKVATALHGYGCDEISLGDTIGKGNPRSTRTLLRELSHQLPLSHLAVHFHDTYGMALVNVYEALEQGVRNIDSAIGGLGGCPYAPGASGNVATEDVVYLVESCGMTTGIDMNKLLDTAAYATRLVNKIGTSKVLSAFKARAEANE